MKVFLSWSGERSQKVAEALKEWLPRVIQSLEPWYSQEDIRKGARWIEELTSNLENSSVGIFCLTHDNLTAPWVMFEAGAISKVKGSLVSTLLLDIRNSDVKGPLEQFEHTSTKKEDVLRLLGSINNKLAEVGEKPLSPETLQDSFGKWWDDLKAKLDEAHALSSSQTPSKRPPQDMLEEVVERLRNQDRNIALLIERSEPDILTNLGIGLSPFSGSGSGSGSGSSGSADFIRRAEAYNNIRRFLSTTNIQRSLEPNSLQLPSLSKQEIEFIERGVETKGLTNYISDRLSLPLVMLNSCMQRATSLTEFLAYIMEQMNLPSEMLREFATISRSDVARREFAEEKLAIDSPPNDA